MRVLASLSLVVAALAFLPSATEGARSPINTHALLHDTRNPSYRSPFGAVPAGTPVTLGLRTARNGASSVLLHVTAKDVQGHSLGTANQALSVSRHTKAYDYWKTVFTPSKVGIYSYDFQIKKGSASVWYSGTILNEGGPGQVYRKKPQNHFEITSYVPGFQAPSWAPNAVIYQIFPDRFYNGDPSNDHNGMDPIYGSDHPYVHSNWNDAPQGGEDFFGGDLQGIDDKLPYLKSLGVNTLYLNPIFEAPSNHKYDTADYMTIDPRFGTLDTYKKLVADAHADGIRIILDGVFNHTGSDSVYFNRYGSFPDTGAYQSKSSPYFPWYTFTIWPTQYDDYMGQYDSLPVLNESAPVRDFFFRTPNSVAQHWLGLGADGWRLDSAWGKSANWWQDFRQHVKSDYPDSIIIGEPDWYSDYLPFLMGDQLDGAMNYHFREAVLGFFAYGAGTQAITPLRASTFYDELMGLLEYYPRPALYSSMNLVGSHDTPRVLTLLNNNKNKLKEIAAFQMTWLGAPTVYYGDEAGLTGGNDPDDRRTFPWDHQDTNLEDFYRKVIGIRNAHPALRDGSVSSLVIDNKHRVLGFLRSDSSEQVGVVFNDDTKTHRETLKGLPNGTLTDAMTGKTHTVIKHRLTASIPAYGVMILTQG